MKLRRSVTRVLILMAVAVAAVAATGSNAFAAPRRVPFGFFGTVLDPELPLQGSPSLLSSQMGLMAGSGVESVRTNFFWEGTEISPGVYNWSQIDAVVRTAASHGLQLLPIIEFTPRWASSHPSGAWDEYAPAHPSAFASFATELVERYGPDGSFWAANPQVPRDPIRAWEIWNEPAGTKYDWRSVPWPSTYVALLKAAYKAIHRADHGAVVVSGAVVGLNTTTLTPWAEANDLYRAGAKRYFDVLAINAFTNAPRVSVSVSRSIEIVDRVRQVMRRDRDGTKPVWVTEVTWTAAAGRIPPADYAGFETTPIGQAQRLTAYFKRIATHRPDGIARAFWYTWNSAYLPQSLFGNPLTFQYSGLVKWQPGQPAESLPLLSTYARVAATFEGCRKTAFARKCR